MNNMENRRFLKVEECDGYVRDAESRGIINRNEEEYLQHKKQKILNNIKAQRQNQQEQRLNSIEADVQAMKSMLQSILEVLKSNGNS